MASKFLYYSPDETRDDIYYRALPGFLVSAIWYSAFYLNCLLFNPDSKKFSEICRKLIGILSDSVLSWVRLDELWWNESYHPWVKKNDFQGAPAAASVLLRLPVNTSWDWIDQLVVYQCWQKSSRCRQIDLHCSFFDAV